eukprot:Pgem_evm1s15529
MFFSISANLATSVSYFMALLCTVRVDYATASAPPGKLVRTTSKWGYSDRSSYSEACRGKDLYIKNAYASPTDDDRFYWKCGHDDNVSFMKKRYGRRQHQGKDDEYLKLTITHDRNNYHDGWFGRTGPDNIKIIIEKAGWKIDPVNCIKHPRIESLSQCSSYCRVDCSKKRSLEAYVTTGKRNCKEREKVSAKYGGRGCNLFSFEVSCKAECPPTPCPVECDKTRKDTYIAKYTAKDL